jgi:hypothetical protein
LLAILAVSMLGNDFLEDRKDFVSQFAVRINVLQPHEKLRDVIPRFGIEHDGSNRQLSQAPLAAS